MLQGNHDNIRNTICLENCKHKVDLICVTCIHEKYNITWYYREYKMVEEYCVLCVHRKRIVADVVSIANEYSINCIPSIYLIVGE